MANTPLVGYRSIGNIKGAPGDKGERGPAGTIDGATVSTVPAGAEATITMGGTEEHRTFHLEVPRGLPGVNAIENDEAVAEYLTAADSKSAAALDSWGRKQGLITVAESALQMDAAQAISDAVASAEVGSTIRIRGQFAVDALVEVDADKHLTLDFTGAVVEVNVPETSAPAAFLARGTYGPSVAVTSVDVVSATIGDRATTTTQLTVAAGHGFEEGDVVKIVSDDTIPGGHYTSDTLRPRMGDFARVLGVGTTSIMLSNVLHEASSYTQNVRVAKASQGTWEIVGGTFFHPRSWTEGTPVSGNIFRGQDLIQPRYRDVLITRLMGMGFSNKSCLGYSVSGCSVTYAMDNVTQGVIGYGVHDSSCVGGEVSGGTWRSLRHVYTDGTNFSPALGVSGVSLEADNITDHGRTLWARVDGITALDCVSACVDTHHMSYGAKVSNSVFHPAPDSYGVQFRGYGHSAENNTVIGGYGGVFAFTQSTSAGGQVWSRGDTGRISIAGLHCDGTQIPIVATMYNSSAHPKSGTIATEKTIFATGVYARGAVRLVQCTNADVTIRDAYVHVRNQYSGSVIDIRGSRLTLRGLEVDTTGVTTVAGPAFICNVDSSGNGSVVDMADTVIRASEAWRENVPVVANVANVDTAYFEWRDVVFAELWPSDPSFSFHPTVRGGITWRYRYNSASASTRGTSAGVALTVSENVSTDQMRPLLRSRDAGMVLTLNVTGTGSYALAAIPGGAFDGQMLSIVLGTASGSAIVRHGSSYNTRLSGDSDKTLTSAGQAIRLIWSIGAWRQFA